MAIAFDTSTSGRADAASSLTYSHTVGTGSNTIIVAQPVLTDLIAGSASISSVTYAAVGMTLVTGSSLAFTLLAAYDIVLAIYGLVAPATGANNVVVTASESCDTIRCGSQSWFGVRQSNSYGTANTATAGAGSQPTVDITSATGEVVVAHVAAVEQTPAVFASADTERWEQSGGDGAVVDAGASQVGATTVTMNWTGHEDTTYEWGCVGVSLKVEPLNTRAWTHGTQVGMGHRMPI